MGVLYVYTLYQKGGKICFLLWEKYLYFDGHHWALGRKNYYVILSLYFLYLKNKIKSFNR